MMLTVSVWCVCAQWNGGGGIKSTVGSNSCHSWYPTASLTKGDKQKYVKAVVADLN